MCGRRALPAALGLLLGAAAANVRAADPNLMGWWRFNDGSGTVAIDSSGHDRHGVLVDGPQWVAGIHGGALAFADGSHVAVPGYDGILGSQARTNAAWVNVTNTSASIITWGPSGSGTKWIVRTHNDPANLRVECGQGNTWGTTDLADGEWHHVAAVLEDDGSPDISEVKLYVDGELDPIAGGTPRAINTSSGGELRIAYDLNNTPRVFTGMMDDVRMSDRALTAEEIQAIMTDPGLVRHAMGPDPTDGAVIDETWYMLSWTPGDLAASHQVYISENFDDVNEGRVEPVSSASSYLVIGLGGPYPSGLTPGVRYYWRVDEVNEAEPDSPWRGNVWSFSVRPTTTWSPVPADGARFVATDAVLSWDPGVGAVAFYVYFGDTFDDVNNATGAPFTTETTYDPGPLEAGKTYYWRVDGSDFQTLQRGKVWSFTTAGGGGGILGEYFNNMGASGQPVLTRIDQNVDFDFGDGSPEAGVVDEDAFSARWRGEIEAAFSETYTFYTRTNDGSRLWLDDKLIVDKWVWVNRVVDTRSTPVVLVAGQRYSIRMEFFNEDTEAEAHLLWVSASQPKGIVPQAALSLPLQAGSPHPPNGQTGVKLIPPLRWVPGVYAASHDVYFGTDEQAVRDAGRNSPEFKGTKAFGDENYDPGKLARHTTYYWRVDEVNDLHPDSPWVGNLWSFTTGAFLVVDDFEDYTDDDTGGEAIWQRWIDGFGVANNGSQVGYLLPPYAEQTIVHSGRQSMPILYENVNGVTNSEVELTLTYPRDWTEHGVSTLTLWFRGDAANAAEPMYVALDGNAIVAQENPAAAQAISWTQWNIDLETFADLGEDLANVNSIAIGLGTKADGAGPGGSGTIYIDDIRLYRP
ncbi:MAG: PA14 domain-containing protein [Sedimentisphaerales bacterium]